MNYRDDTTQPWDRDDEPEQEDPLDRAAWMTTVCLSAIRDLIPTLNYRDAMRLADLLGPLFTDVTELQDLTYKRADECCAQRAAELEKVS